MTSQRLPTQFAVSLLAVMFALWAFRLREGTVEFSALLLAWLAFPATAFALAVAFRGLPLMRAALFSLNLVYCVVYGLSCLAGDGGDNLPLLFVPMLLAVFSVLYIPALHVYGWAKARLKDPLASQYEKYPEEQ